MKVLGEKQPGKTPRRSDQRRAGAQRTRSRVA
jgi:hypothetical protein